MSEERQQCLSLLEPNFNETIQSQSSNTIDGLGEMDNVEIEYKIVHERNSLIQTLTDDISVLQELFYDCSNMIFGQGVLLRDAEKNIETALENVEQGTESLKQAEMYHHHARGKLFDICVVAGGVGLGAIGFVAGPIVGIPTVAAGLGISGGVVLIRNKLHNIANLKEKDE